MSACSGCAPALINAAALSLIAAQLSTWAEEWILWASTEFNFHKLPQDYCTGSSMMPQKLNPDVLEKTRRKTPRELATVTR